MLPVPYPLARLVEDAVACPLLFVWNGRVEDVVVDGWLAERQLVVPEDVRALWIETGGGTIFETEELLAPAAPDEPTLISSPVAGVVFYSGAFGRAAIQQPGGNLVLIDRDETVHPLSSLAAWYFLIRGEFAQRYGLRITAVLLALVRS